MNANRRVVITGRGVLSPLGCDWPSFAAAVRAGDAASAGPLPGALLDDPILCYCLSNPEALAPFASGREAEPLSTLAIAAAKEAMDEAGIASEGSPLDDVGLVMNTVFGPSAAVEEYLEQLSPEERAKLDAEAEAQAAPVDGADAEPALVGAKLTAPELAAVAGVKELEEAPAEAKLPVEAPAAGEAVAADPAKPQIRFAEEILPGAREVEDKGSEAGKAAKPKKKRKKRRVVQEDEDEDESVQYDVH